LAWRIVTSRTNHAASGFLCPTPLSFVANLVLGDAGIPARFPLGAVRPFRFGGWSAEAGTHELLSGVAGHAACLRIAILHSLLLSGDLSARWRCQRDHYGDGDQMPFHPVSLSRMLRRTGS
jgi:hypothetical protein